jgi:hypothetical protein
MPRRMMSVEEGRELIQRWRDSGLSQTAFAKREQLDQSRVSFWMRRLQKLDGETPKTPAKRTFVRVQPRPPVRQDGMIEVVVRAELCVRVRGDFDEQVLRRVLAVARELAC